MDVITIASKPLGIKKVWFFEEKKVLSVKILSRLYKYVIVFYFYKNIWSFPGEETIESKVGSKFHPNWLAHSRIDP